MLPVLGVKPNHENMALLISAIHKMVKKEVVEYADKNIEATKEVK